MKQKYEKTYLYLTGYISQWWRIEWQYIVHTWYCLLSQGKCQEFMTSKYESFKFKVKITTLQATNIERKKDL